MSIKFCHSKTTFAASDEDQDFKDNFCDHVGYTKKKVEK